MSPAEYLKKPYGRVVVPEPDGTYRAEIVEFPGCLATGDTAQDALAKLEDVALAWLDATLTKNKRVPEPIENDEFSGKLMLRLSKSLHRRAAHQAARDGVSLNQFIGNCVAEQVGAKFASSNFQAVAGTWQNFVTRDLPAAITWAAGTGIVGDQFFTVSTGNFAISGLIVSEDAHA